MAAVGEGFTCGNFEAEDSRYAWVSPTVPLPQLDTSRSDKARDRFLAVLRERGLLR